MTVNKKAANKQAASEPQTSEQATTKCITRKNLAEILPSLISMLSEAQYIELHMALQLRSDFLFNELASICDGSGSDAGSHEYLTRCKRSLAQLCIQLGMD